MFILHYDKTLCLDAYELKTPHRTALMSLNMRQATRRFEFPSHRSWLQLVVVCQPSDEFSTHPITNSHLFHRQLNHLSFLGLTNPLTSPCCLISPRHCSHCNEACSTRHARDLSHTFSILFSKIYSSKNKMVYDGKNYQSMFGANYS